MVPRTAGGGNMDSMNSESKEVNSEGLREMIGHGSVPDEAPMGALRAVLLDVITDHRRSQRLLAPPERRLGRLTLRASRRVANRGRYVLGPPRRCALRLDRLATAGTFGCCVGQIWVLAQLHNHADKHRA